MRHLPLLAAGLALSACATRPTPVAFVPFPETVAVAAAIPVQPSPINRDLSPAATVWHLRAGLNVAALACRGAQGKAIVARYNALLTTQKTALADAQHALASEFRMSGGNWQARYDTAMTRLYNFFSQSPARDRFCAAAAAVLTDTATLAPDALSGFAAHRLPEIDAPFVTAVLPTPVIAIAAPVPQAPTRPWLTVDVAALD